MPAGATGSRAPACLVRVSCRSATCCSPGATRSTTPRSRSSVRACRRAELAGAPAAVRALRAGGVRATLAAGAALGRDAPARGSSCAAARGPPGAAARRALRGARFPHPRRHAGVARRAPGAASRRTVLLVTHDVEEATFLADRVAVPRRGRRVVASSSGDLPDAPALSPTLPCRAEAPDAGGTKPMTRALLAALLLVPVRARLAGSRVAQSVDDLRVASRSRPRRPCHGRVRAALGQRPVTLVEVLLGLAVAGRCGGRLAVAMHLIAAGARRGLSAARRLPGNPRGRARADLRARLRLRHRAEGRDRCPDLLFADHRQPARRAALDAARAAEADAQPRRVRLRACVRSSCRPRCRTCSAVGSRGDGVGDRRRVRGMGRRRRGPGAAGAARQQPASRPARLRRGRPAHPDGGGAVRGGGSAESIACPWTEEEKLI